MNWNWSNWEKYAVAALVIVVAILGILFGDRVGTGNGMDPPKVVYIFEPLHATTTVPSPGLWERKKASPQKLANVRQSLQSATVPTYDGYCELPRVDREQTNSSFCLTCHDGSSGHSVDAARVGGTGSHPVNIPVPWGSAGYKPLALTVVTPFNKMECTTCHDYWFVPQQPKWGAFTTEQQCVVCHDK